MAEINGGYILTSRKLINSAIYKKPPNYLKVWMYLLSKASHQKHGNLKRGQGFCSIPELMEVCTYYVGARPKKATKKEIWNILEWLRNPNEGDAKGTRRGTMIETTRVTHGFLYTIVKYNYYQTPSNYESNSEGNNEEDTKGTRKGQQGNNINKNYNKNKECKNKDIVVDVIDYLNKKANKNFKHTTKNTIKHINARVKEGFTKEDMMEVVDKKVAAWGNDPKMEEYLRPPTLFGTKMESYVNEKAKVSDDDVWKEIMEGYDD